MSTASPWPVIGHEWAVQLLAAALASGRLPHAVLLTGSRQVGKRTLALALAAALNCTADAGPCGLCRSCRRIAHGSHPDVQLIEAEDGRGGREGVLKIDQIRALQRAVALAPMESRYKVFVLRDIDQANLPATNALLKTLEEPPSQVVLLLTSSRPHRLLPTVISRCQVIPLRPLPQEQIASALITHWHAEPEQARLLSRLSEGRLGWAVERLTEGEIWEQRTRGLADIQELAGSSAVQRLAHAEALSKQPAAVQPTLILWASWWRDLLLVQQECSEYISNVDRRPELQAHASMYDTFQVRRFLQRLSLAPLQLNQNVNVRLLLETLLLHMPTAQLG